MTPLKFIVLPQTLNIHRLEPGDSIPKAVLSSPFFSISRTDEEISIVVPDNVEIKTAKTEPGWRALKVAGPLDFSLTGILAGISQTLAAAGVSIFAISTFDTDYILVRGENLKAAKEALQVAGHKFGRVAQKEEPKDENLLKQGYTALLEKQIPLIRNLFVEKIGPGALATLRSEAALAAAVGGLYEFLPTPIRLVVNREVFITFCVHNLDKILPDVPQPGPKPKTKKAK